MYRRILVPTDGSVGTAHVALQAIDLAEQYGAEIHALHVIDDDLRSFFAGDEGELEERADRAVDLVEGLADAHGVAVVTAVERGDPAETIVDYADGVDVDLIVTGTHGRSGVERRLIGSVAERLVRHAPCPVMTVRLPGTDVTVDSADAALAVAREALGEEGVDAEITGAERQRSVWAVEADGPDGSVLVYVDPVTQRTSVVS